MSSDKFEITTDPSQSLLRITMRGHWTVDTVREYKDALIPTIERMLAAGCVRANMIALVDTREGGVQAQEVIAEYQKQLGESGLAPRRLATLVSSALFKRQVERIAILNQRLFTDEAEALAWLLAPDESV